MNLLLEHHVFHVFPQKLQPERPSMQREVFEQQPHTKDVLCITKASLNQEQGVNKHSHAATVSQNLDDAQLSAISAWLNRKTKSGLICVTRACSVEGRCCVTITKRNA